jgi:hypothetical protein
VTRVIPWSLSKDVACVSDVLAIWQVKMESACGGFDTFNVSFWKKIFYIYQNFEKGVIYFAFKNFLNVASF